MLRLMTDEDFNGRIIRGVIRLLPNLDLLRVQDVGLLSASDAEVLEAAANDRRIVATHDARTMPQHAYDRVRDGNSMPGLIVCPQYVAVGDIALLSECSDEDEWENKVIYLPL